MSTNYSSAQQAANQFLLQNLTAPTTTNNTEIRELQDNLAVIDSYLKKKRQEIEARLRDNV